MCAGPVAPSASDTEALELRFHTGTDDTCRWSGGGGRRGLLGTLGPSSDSFSLPQDDVDEAADQRQREGDPGQDVGVAEGVHLRHPLWTHHRVDDGAAHHEQT